jgi:CheY-like chemotaxis protein
MILAIDDDPERFDGLRTFLGRREQRGADPVRFEVATCARCVADLLPHATAILLDYDLDGCEGCVRCRRDQGAAKGTDHLDAVAALGVPVIVVSANATGGQIMFRRLREAGARVTLIRVLETEPEIRWLGWLWSEGVL